MEHLDVYARLAGEENDALIRTFFCCEYPENALVINDEERNIFLRLEFDCRSGMLFLSAYAVQEAPLKQLYHRYGDEAVHFIPVVSIWVRETAPALDMDDVGNLYPPERLSSNGYAQWKSDAMAYIAEKYQSYLANIRNGNLPETVKAPLS